MAKKRKHGGSAKARRNRKVKKCEKDQLVLMDDGQYTTLLNTLSESSVNFVLPSNQDKHTPEILAKLLSLTDTELFILTGDFGVAMFTYFHDGLMSALDRKVRVRILASEGAPKALLQKFVDHGAEISTYGKKLAHVADIGYFIFSDGHRYRWEPGKRDDEAQWATMNFGDKYVVRTLTSTLEETWDEFTPVRGVTHVN